MKRSIIILCGLLVAGTAQAAFFWEGLGPFVQSDGQGSEVIVVKPAEPQPVPQK